MIIRWGSVICTHVSWETQWSVGTKLGSEAARTPYIFCIEHLIVVYRRIFLLHCHHEVLVLRYTNALIQVQPCSSPLPHMLKSLSVKDQKDSASSSHAMHPRISINSLKP